MDGRGTSGRGPVQLTEHTWLTGITEFPYYLVAGTEACALFEGGISGVAPLAMEHVESLGLGVPLKYLVCAHTHTDHVTGLIQLKRANPELVFVGTAETAAVLAKEKVVTHFAHEDVMYNKNLVAKGVLPEEPAPMSGAPVTVDRTVGAGDTLDLGGTVLEFHPTPGHAPGHLCARVLPERALFISDAAGYAGSTRDVYPMFFHNYADYNASLGMLAAMDFDRMFLGHNVACGSAGEGRAFLEHALAESRTMQADMVRRMGAGEPREEIAADWGARLAEFTFFRAFDKRILDGFADLLIRRALEAEEA